MKQSFVFNRLFLAMAEYSSKLELCSFGLTKKFLLMLFKCRLNMIKATFSSGFFCFLSHFVFAPKNHISFFQSCAFGFAVITLLRTFFLCYHFNMTTTGTTFDNDCVKPKDQRELVRFGLASNFRASECN